jgi:putative restriction endonuclease
MNFETLLLFLNDPSFDTPFFKRLAHNDTGQAVGHVAGIVIPQALRRFFPTLDANLINAQAPTVDRHLIAAMLIPGRQLATDTVRYQFQTWGGTRRPESRLTENLGPIRDIAHADDILLMQRSRDLLTSYRLLLVRQQDEAFQRLNALTAGRRCGPLFEDRPPIAQQELVQARDAMLADAQQPFVPIRANVQRVPVARAAIARDAAFRETLLVQYQQRCAVSGLALATATEIEVQAAHVVPLARGGPDEPRNGLTLTSTLHWAFDRGLFGITDARTVLVPARVQTMAENQWLVQFHNHPVAQPATAALATAQAAFTWHRENIVAPWL